MTEVHALRLGDIAEIRIGRTPARDNPAYWTADLTRPFCTITDMQDRFVDPGREGVTALAVADGKAKPVPAGALLMSFKLSIGRVGYAAREIYPNEAIAWIEPQPDRCSKEFLGFYLEHQDLASGGAQAVKGKTLNQASLKMIPVLLPTLAEQRRITEVLTEVEANLLLAARERSAAVALLGAVRQEALRGHEEQPLLDLVTFAGGYSFKPSYQGRSSGDYPFAKVSDMNACDESAVLVMAANWVTSADLKALGARAHPAGTVVFPKVGAALLTEKRRVLGRDMAFDNNVMGLVPSAGLSPRYLLAWSETVVLGDFAQPGAVPSINQGHLTPLKIPVPALSQQDRIVEMVDAARQGVLAARERSVALLRLKTALLDKLLPAGPSGEQA